MYFNAPSTRSPVIFRVPSMTYNASSTQPLKNIKLDFIFQTQILINQPTDLNQQFHTVIDDSIFTPNIQNQIRVQIDSFIKQKIIYINIRDQSRPKPAQLSQSTNPQSNQHIPDNSKEQQINPFVRANQPHQQNHANQSNQPNPPGSQNSPAQLSANAPHADQREQNQPRNDNAINNNQPSQNQNPRQNVQPNNRPVQNAPAQNSRPNPNAANPFLFAVSIANGQAVNLPAQPNREKNGVINPPTSRFGSLFGNNNPIPPQNNHLINSNIPNQRNQNNPVNNIQTNLFGPNNRNNNGQNNGQNEIFRKSNTNNNTQDHYQNNLYKQNQNNNSSNNLFGQRNENRNHANNLFGQKNENRNCQNNLFGRNEGNNNNRSNNNIFARNSNNDQHTNSQLDNNRDTLNRNNHYNNQRDVANQNNNNERRNNQQQNGGGMNMFTNNQQQRQNRQFSLVNQNDRALTFFGVEQNQSIFNQPQPNRKNNKPQNGLNRGRKDKDRI